VHICRINNNNEVLFSWLKYFENVFVFLTEYFRMFASNPEACSYFIVITVYLLRVACVSQWLVQ